MPDFLFRVPCRGEVTSNDFLVQVLIHLWSTAGTITRGARLKVVCLVVQHLPHIYLKIHALSPEIHWRVNEAKKLKMPETGKLMMERV